MFDYNKIEQIFPEAGNLMWEPMLIWSLPENKKDQLYEICQNKQYFASLKKDGAFYQFVKTNNYEYLFGRTVSKINGLLTEKIANVPHIQQALKILPSNTVLVVEIYYPKKTSKDVVSIMGSLPARAIALQKDNLIHAYCHDILYYDNIDLRNTKAENRYKILAKIWEKYHLDNYNFLELAKPIYENIYEEINKALAEGEEGMVLRKKDSPWVCGKRPAWSTIKVKQMDTVDLVCIGFCDATKEYTGKELDNWPYWETAEGELIIAEHPENCHPVTKPYYFGWKTAMRVGAFDGFGKLIEIGTVSSGLTDEDREKMATHPEEYLNKVFEFSCMSLDKKEHTLRHPRIVKKRDDKSAKDCKISEIFQ